MLLAKKIQTITKKKKKSLFPRCIQPGLNLSLISHHHTLYIHRELNGRFIADVLQENRIRLLFANLISFIILNNLTANQQCIISSHRK